MRSFFKKLVRSYGLDALDASGSDASVGPENVSAFLKKVTSVPCFTERHWVMEKTFTEGQKSRAPLCGLCISMSTSVFFISRANRQNHAAPGPGFRGVASAISSGSQDITTKFDRDRHFDPATVIPV